MSFDLLKEFGDIQESPSSHVPGQIIKSEQGNDEDDFGNFERPESPKTNTGTQPGLGGPSESRPSLPVFGDTVSKERAQLTEQPKDASVHKIEPTSNDDDDWGDFNGTTVLFDAEELHVTEQALWHQNHHHQSQAHKSLAEKPVKVSLLPISSREATTRRVKPPQVDSTALYDFDRTESWEPVIARQDPILPTGVIRPAALSTIPDVKGTLGSTVQARDMGPPPSNIPPPSVLLSLVATLFQSLLSDVRNIVTQNRASSDPSEALDQPPRIDQIRGVLSSTKVAARIIAGRKLRWKRDNLLAQSVKIGPAGKSGGMKLTGVDKTQSRREDQDTAEALGVWRKQVGPLRSTISTVNVHLPGSGFAIPEISENMPIRVVKPSEGAVTAPKCCFLCGIKREERVAKVDVDVEDSFCEFWTEHWGHVECVAFWQNHKHSLPQR